MRSWQPRRLPLRFESWTRSVRRSARSLSRCFMPEERELAPARVSRRLFVVSPDRDERASHLTMETLLTLWANDYSPPRAAYALVTPKRRNGPLRSLAVRENFLVGVEGAV